jgi:hypothetical protein
MLYLYLDESGDLGFDFVNKRPSAFFTICVLAIKGRENDRALVSAVRAVLRRKRLLRADKAGAEIKKSFIDPRVPLDIIHINSHESPGLQAVDMFAWGIFRKYEKADLEWFNVFKARVCLDRSYLP